MTKPECRLPSTIYPVVDDARWFARLGGAGARFIQLRVKDLSKADLERQVAEAASLALAHGVELVLNDYWQLAIQDGRARPGIPWVHLGQEDLDTADRDAIRHAGLKLGISTHDNAELTRALALEPDYVALGPIWPTKLKQMPFGPQGLERLHEWRTLCGDVPLVAIGGITCERAPSCIAAGADSVAAVSDFICNDDPEQQVRRWLVATTAS